MADAGIPIAVIYELPHIPYELRNRLRPKYDVVYVALEAEHAALELPWLCAGKLDGLQATCDVGSNTDRGLREKVAPRAILFYPKITDEEVERVMSEIRAEPGAIEVRPLHLRKEELGLFEGWQVEEEDIARMAAKVGAKLDEFFA